MMSRLILGAEQKTNNSTEDTRTAFMNANRHEQRTTNIGANGLSRPLKTALLMVASVSGFFLLRNQLDHVAGNWIYLLLLACPLMHFFHGHGGHTGHAGPVDKATPPISRKE